MLDALEALPPGAHLDPQTLARRLGAPPEVVRRCAAAAGVLGRLDGPAPPPARGARVGPWELLAELARGGHGVVYRARRAPRGEEVALKLLLGLSPLRRARFGREALALTRLRHPGLVRVLDAGESPGAPWIAMELIPGESLQARLARDGPLPVSEAVELVRGVADAIAHAHEQGVLHRDLKPANVLVRPDGQPVVTDFGLVRELDPELDGTALTASGMALGTPGYWAPELSLGPRQAIGPRTDVYGLGGLLFACLTAQPPQAGTSLLELLAASQRLPAGPRQLVPAVPLELDALCLACLQPDPSRRPPSALAVARALRASEPGPRRHARRRLPLAAGTVLALGFGWAVSGVGSSPAPAAPAPTAREETPAGLFREHARRVERDPALLLELTPPLSRLLSGPEAPPWTGLARAIRLAPRAYLCAQALLDTLARAHPEEPWVHLLRAAVPSRSHRDPEGARARAALARARALGAPPHLCHLAEADQLQVAPGANQAALRQPLERAAATLPADTTPEGRAWVACRRGVELLAAGDGSAAAALFQPALEQAPTRLPEDMLVAGVSALLCHSREPGALEPWLARILDARGRGADRLAVPRTLFLAWALAGREPEAEAQLARLQAAGHDPGELALLRARARTWRGDSPGSLAALRAAGDGLGLEGLRERAGLHALVGDRQAALRDYDALLARSPEDLDALARSAALLQQLGRWQEAAASLDRVLAGHPWLTPARFGRAVARKRAGQDAGALEDALAVLPRLDELDESKLAGLAELLADLGRPEQAQQVRRALEAHAR